MTDFPGVHRKGPGRGWIYRWREFDHAKGKIVKHTSEEFNSARKAAQDRTQRKADLTRASVALRQPHRQGITLEQAWESHPSTVRENATRREKYRKYLKAFTDHTGIVALHKLTYAEVSDWVQHLLNEKKAWATRMHYLMPIRRAARMAPSHGLPDVLAHLQIDERPDEQQEIQAWTLPQIMMAWKALADNRRARVCLGLGAFLGLRPSEIYRLRCGDLDAENRLSIGLKQAGDTDTRPVKNKSSRRCLPIPSLLLPELRALIGTRAPDAPLIATARDGKPFNEVTLAEWLGPILREKTGHPLKVKHLRKSFATWALSAGLDFYHIEAYLGRATPLTTSITGRHYIADLYRLISRQLDPTALAIDRHLRTALKDKTIVAQTQRETEISIR